jgi:hypothetical protein
LSLVKVDNLEEDNQSLVAEEFAERNDLRNEHHVAYLSLVKQVHSIEDFISYFFLNLKISL